MAHVFKTDIGTSIVLDVGIDVTGASGISIEVKKPSGAQSSWSAVLYSGNKSIEHVIVTNDLDEIGDYILQAKLTLGSGTWRGDPAILTVRASFK